MRSRPKARSLAQNRAEVETYISDMDYLPGALGFTLHAELETGTSYIRVGGEAGAVTGTYAIRAMVNAEYSGFPIHLRGHHHRL